MSTEFLNLIGGEFAAAADGRTFETEDPARGEPYARVAEAGREDVRRAVAAAREAFDAGPWPRYSAAERRRLLNRLADRVEKSADRIAAAETRDMGKPIGESREHDLPRVVRNLRFFADYQSFVHDEAYSNPGFHTFTAREPVGVVAAISPWNFPLMLATWKVAPALAFGNTVVLKPAEQSPATATLLAELAADVLPPGVLNVVHGFGPDAAGEFLVASSGVDLITFTGETRTATQIMAAAAPTLKGLSFELGGKSPNIVFADADLDRAVAATLKGIFGNQGEVCLAGSRLFVERPIQQEFMDRLAREAARLRVGDPTAAETQMGPLVSAQHRERVESYVEIALADGGELVTGGSRPDDPALAAGYYLEPTIVGEVPVTSRASQEEIFGPVLVATAFDREDEVVDWANGTEYGLAGMVWTRDLDRAHRVALGIRSGVIWVNCFFVRDLRTPFGGAKRSGIGREGGIHSRDFFTEAKTVTIAVGELG